jgi:hypothetical protein
MTPAEKSKTFEKEKNVYRIDIDATNTHGWQVRITRQGCHFRKFFPDHAHDHELAASREAAIEHRDFLLDMLPDLPEGKAGHLHTDEVREKAWKKLTRTGVKGIGYTMKVDSQRGGRRPYASAHWSDDEGRRHSAQRSIMYHGVEKAVRQVTEVLAEKTDHELSAEEMLETALPAIKRMLTRDLGREALAELLAKDEETAEAESA